MSVDKNLINDHFTFPKYNSETIDIQAELSAATRQIQRVVSSANKVNPCHLSFYPVAKNIRFVSSSFYSSIKAGMRPYMSDHCRPGEDYFWTEMTGMSWYPWLWTRYENPAVGEGCRASWGRLFMDIEDGVACTPGYVGGMSYSEYGLSGWFLQMAEQKAITPYYNIEGEFCLTGHPVQMLLH